MGKGRRWERKKEKSGGAEKFGEREGVGEREREQWRS